MDIGLHEFHFNETINLMPLVDRFYADSGKSHYYLSLVQFNSVQVFATVDDCKYYPVNFILHFKLPPS
jgi:hypothetical protein